jgi:hypothetical protein
MKGGRDAMTSGLAKRCNDVEAGEEKVQMERTE